MAPRTRTYATILAGVVVAVVPALLSYLQSRDELKTKYQETQDEASGGYTALAASVKELQTTVTAQHDYIIKLEANVETLQQEVAIALQRPGVTTGTHRPTIDVARPPARPKFDELPHDFPDAAAKFAPKR